ncbi:MAG TPA: hypothetical protein VKE22_08895 [Haliangiales bacterium]|nr:hypothetical protein [Haliangiales bacterium]
MIAIRRPATLCAVLIVGLAAWEILALWRVHADAPEPSEWQTAQSVVRKGFHKGDLIVFAPAWIDPIGRAYLGDLMALEDVARNDAGRYGRIWEVSTRGASAPETRGLAAVEDADAGAVRVRRFERAAPRAVWSTNDRARLLEVAFAPHLCVLLPPSRDAEHPGRLDLGTVPLGTELRAWGGLADFRARKENWAAAVVRVLVDDKEGARASVANDDGWVALPPVATTAEAHHVVVEAWVDPERGDPARARLDLCVAAEARTP